MTLKNEVDFEGVEPSAGGIESPQPFHRSPLVRIALAWVLFSYVVGCLDANTAQVIVKILLPLA